MAVIVPFRALRPKSEFIKAVASLPYDVVSYEEAKQIAGPNPMNYLHVEKSEIDLPADIAAHDQSIFDRAKINLDRLVREGVLFQDKKASFYIYSQEMNGHRQYGIVGGISVAEYEKGKIKKHELTRADKEIDRIRHVDRVNAHTGPVFTTYRARPFLDRLVEEAVQARPEYDFVTDDGIAHTVWIVDDDKNIAAIIREFAAIDSLYIADGHHRALAATGVAKMRREQETPVRNAEYEHMLAVLIPHRQVKIMDYNRVIKDLHGLSATDFLKSCENDFVLSPDFQEKTPKNFQDFGMYLAGKWYRLRTKDGVYDKDDPIGRLDVSILQERLLGPLLAIHDPRTDNRIKFVGGIRGPEELERLVDSGRFSVAFSLYPVTIEQLMEVADADLTMPPKSTWFEPKLRSGIFPHLLD